MLSADFITINTLRISSFGKYSELEVSIDTVPGIFEKLLPDVAQEYKTQIENGECVIRYRFTYLDGSSYSIGYKVGEEEKNSIVKIKSPYNFYNLEKPKGNIVGFMFCNDDIDDKAFSFDKITNISLLDFTFTVELFSVKTNSLVSHTTTKGTSFAEAVL